MQWDSHNYVKEYIISHLSYVENGFEFDPYQGSFNESPAFPW